MLLWGTEFRRPPVLPALCEVGHAVCLLENWPSVGFHHCGNSISLERDENAFQHMGKLYSLYFRFYSVWLYFPLFNLWLPHWLLTPYVSVLSLPQSPFICCLFAFLSLLCKLLTYWQLSHLLPLNLSHLFPTFVSFLCNALLSPFLSSVVFVPRHLTTFPLDIILSTFLLTHLLSSISSIQLYDLGSPADSQSSSPGCLTTDSSCVNMGYPSCGHRGRCHGEWGSFSCQCVPGYTGHQCEEGKPNLFWTIALKEKH